jgi:RimJ/RimL family protein N-acetyltransferase
MLRELQTRRLVLRPLELADAGQLQRVFPQWEIVQHLNARVPWPYPPDGALTFLRDVALPAMARGEQWNWSIRLKAAPAEIIGSIGLIRGESDNRGFWLAPPWRGQGLMTEATEAVNDYWFETLGFPVMRVAKAQANAASRRISEKNGMRLIGTEARDYVCGRLPSEVWEITAEEWRRHRERLRERR